MTVAAWKAATLYLPGDIVRSTASSPVTNQVIPNADFESGDTAWTKTNATIENVAGFTGAWRAKMVYAAGSPGGVLMAATLPISPGQTVNASCMMMPSGASVGVGGQVRVLWFDASSAYITGKDVVGNAVDVSNGSGWRKSSVSGIAPSNAASFKVQGEAYNGAVAGVVLFDAFMLSVTGGPASNNLIFKATQAAAATSGTSEPVWPTTLAGTVVDGGVTWTAIDAVVITWKATPILESGATEPTWPTNLGDTVADGSIAWEVVPRRIEDENCPNSKVVLILASKVYATDEDIVRFSATANPKDWTSMQDAGYLPTGLQSANANDMAVLAQYRGNLVPMNANCMQNWQVDPDPQAMALLDQMEGIGSTWNKAAQPVANDLFYLSQLGVRSIGISASTENLAAGDVGMPIDELVQAALAESTSYGVTPISTYYPGAGQYWLAFPQLDPVACSIATTFQGGQSVPSTTVVSIGSATGQMIFNFATGGVPDKAEVWIGGTKVLDTGWWGDPAKQAELDSACALVGISSGTINAIPHVAYSAYQQWDALEAAAFVIDKNTADTTAIVKVFAPIGNTAWKFRLGCPNDLTLEPKPPLFLSGNIPDGYLDDVVSGAYVAVGGMLPYVSFAVVSGAFPTGLTLNTDGTYSGTLTTAGSYSWTVRVTDAAGQTAEAADSCIVIVNRAAFFDGLGDYITAPFAAPIIASGNFTIQARASINSFAGGHRAIISGRNSNIRGWALQFYAIDDDSAYVAWRMSMNTGVIDTVSGLSSGAITVATNQMVHVAVTRQDDLFTLWIDGQAVDTYTNAGTIDEPAVTEIAIGTSYKAIAENLFFGYLDWLSVNIGECLYTEDFTPPVKVSNDPNADIDLEFNEALGSTTFTDNGTLGLTWTRTGDVVIAEYPY